MVEYKTVEKIPFLDMDPEFSELQLVRSRFFGDVASVLSLSPIGKFRPMRTVSELLFPAFRHGQFKVFYNRLAQPIGYVLWANLSAATEGRILKSLNPSLHLSEWNEGGRLWIIDFVCQREMLLEVAGYCMSQLFVDAETAVVQKENNGRLIFKEVDRDGLNHLLSRFQRLGQTAFAGL